jgi:hypothetical protein
MCRLCKIPNTEFPATVLSYPSPPLVQLREDEVIRTAGGSARTPDGTRRAYAADPFWPLLSIGASPGKDEMFLPQHLQSLLHAVGAAPSYLPGRRARAQLACRVYSRSRRTGDPHHCSLLSVSCQVSEIERSVPVRTGKFGLRGTVIDPGFHTTPVKFTGTLFTIEIDCIVGATFSADITFHIGELTDPCGMCGALQNRHDHRLVGRIPQPAGRRIHGTEFGSLAP